MICMTFQVLCTMSFVIATFGSTIGRGLQFWPLYLFVQEVLNEGVLLVSHRRSQQVGLVGIVRNVLQKPGETVQTAGGKDRVGGVNIGIRVGLGVGVG